MGLKRSKHVRRTDEDGLRPVRPPDDEVAWLVSGAGRGGRVGEEVVIGLELAEEGELVAFAGVQSWMVACDLESMMK